MDCMAEIEIELYETALGKRPFEIWIKGIKEIHTEPKSSRGLIV